jgi:PD-(D/E)XK nuclease superfamily protein
MTRFVVYSGRETLLEWTLGSSGRRRNFKIRETAKIGFEVDDPPENQEYEIFIGDIPLPGDVTPEDFGDSIRWRASQHLDGASGVTPITLRDPNNGAVLARVNAMVEPSKLSSLAYERMFEDIRRINVELLLDLASKSRVAVSSGLPLRRGSLKALTARIELGQIRRFWRGFSILMAEIIEEPESKFERRTLVSRLRGGERLDGTVMRRFAERGLRARQAFRTGLLLQVSTALPTRNTCENKVLVAFVNILCVRVERCLTRAKDERDMRYSRLIVHPRKDVALRKFVRKREEPKIAKLQEIIENAEVMLGEMRRAIGTLAVPVRRMSPRDLVGGLDTPTFRSHPRYSPAAWSMRRFLNNTAIIVEQGDSVEAKSIATIYEQWVFIQVCAALRTAGLSCISHKSIFEPISSDRFSVDLDRNAAIVFETPDQRLVRLRYEPTVLPRHAAQGIDSLYRGKSSSPWTPDILLEVLNPGEGPRDYRLVYVAVIDAKYTKSHNIEKRLGEIEKYREIRSVDTGLQIARQVWVAAPVFASLEPSDDAITWSATGEVSANPLDVIVGKIGVDPANPDRTRTILKAYVLGTLNLALNFARATRPELP